MPERLRLTFHARKAMADRDISERDILWVVDRPEQSWLTIRHGRENRTLQRGPFSVVIGDDGESVVTVLCRTQQRWDNAYAKSHR